MGALMTISMNVSKTKTKAKGVAATQAQYQIQPQPQLQTFNVCWYCKQAVKLKPCLITNNATNKDAVGTMCDRCIDCFCNEDRGFMVQVMDM